MMRGPWTAVFVGALTGLAWVQLGALTWPARLLTALLLVPVPALFVLQARLGAGLEDLPRMGVYGTSAATQWILAAFTAIAAAASGFTAYELGVRWIGWLPTLAWTAGLIALELVIVLAARALGMREAPLLAQLLPRTRHERVAFAGLSVTAGICEEFIFRSFLITALWIGTDSLVVAVLLAAGAFGVVHAYQRPAGAARAAGIGLLLSLPLVVSGSIVPAMLAHAAIDLIAGLWLRERLTG